MSISSSYMKSTLLVLLAVVAMGFPAMQAKDRKDPPPVPGPELRIHPKVFTYIQGWLSDGESPIATEINLDAVQVSRNQFNLDEIKEEDGWVQAPGLDGKGFRRYRVLESKGRHYKIEYQENGGGSLTTSCLIECDVEKRAVWIGGKPVTIRVLRVLSYADKP